MKTIYRMYSYITVGLMFLLSTNDAIPTAGVFCYLFFFFWFSLFSIRSRGASIVFLCVVKKYYVFFMYSAENRLLRDNLSAINNFYLLLFNFLAPTLARYPYSCSALSSEGVTVSGTYTIYPDGPLGSSHTVYCDMVTDGGGWMLTWA
jgi:hypothetical protein